MRSMSGWQFLGYPRIKYTCVLEDPYGDNNGSNLT